MIAHFHAVVLVTVRLDYLKINSSIIEHLLERRNFFIKFIEHPSICIEDLYLVFKHRLITIIIVISNLFNNLVISLLHIEQKVAKFTFVPVIAVDITFFQEGHFGILFGVVGLHKFGVVLN